MKRYGTPVLLALSIFFGLMPTSSASVTPGTVCSKEGIKELFQGNSFICIKSGLTLLWSKGLKVNNYDSAFAKSHLLEAQTEAREILANAKAKADQIRRPPNCTTSNSNASVSFGSSDIWLLALVFKNPGICDITVRASAAFLCPDGKIQKLNNFVTSTGIFPLRAGEKLSVAVNVPYYFPQVLDQCRSLTRFSTNLATISTYHQSPSVMTLTSNYSGTFNQAAATKQADQLLSREKARANKLIVDAKNPKLIAKAWQESLEAKIAAENDAIWQVVREEKAAEEKAAEEKAAEEKAAADAKAAAEDAADEALGKPCVEGRSCKKGRTGPGGGIVFYDAGSQQSWGRYLEFAPRGWSGDGENVTQWCEKVDELVGASGQKIGTGKANTDLIVTSCTSGAAVMARAYRGGGKDDWSLPSQGELSALYSYNSDQRDQSKTNTSQFGGYSYWSSSENGRRGAWYRTFDYGRESASVKGKDFYVAPVRAF